MTIDITKLRELPLKSVPLTPDRPGTVKPTRTYTQGELFPVEDTPPPAEPSVNQVTSVNQVNQVTSVNQVS